MRRPILLQPLLLFTAQAVLAGEPGADALTLQNGPRQQAAKQTETLHDIHGPLPTAEYPPYLMPTAVAILALVLLALLIYFLKRRKKPQPPALAPWDKALIELAEARQLLSGGQNLLYMDVAAQILRRYIELRFALRSTRQTTREFFAGLKDADHAPLVEHRAALRACLEQADMAKFAHLVADERHMLQMEEAVRTFITGTRPEVEPPGGRS